MKTRLAVSAAAAAMLLLTGCLIGDKTSISPGDFSAVEDLPGQYHLFSVDDAGRDKGLAGSGTIAAGADRSYNIDIDEKGKDGKPSKKAYRFSVLEFKPNWYVAVVELGKEDKAAAGLSKDKAGADDMNVFYALLVREGWGSWIVARPVFTKDSDDAKIKQAASSLGIDIAVVKLHFMPNFVKGNVTGKSLRALFNDARFTDQLGVLYDYRLRLARPR